MLSATEARVLALAFLVGLVAAGAASRPALGGRGPGRRALERSADVPATAEALWLACVAAVYLYPAAVGVGLPGAYAPFPVPGGVGTAVIQEVGFALGFVGVALLPWSFRALGRFSTFRIELREDHGLVATGPYARIRHPLYTANMLVAFGGVIAFLSPWLLVPAVVLGVVALRRARTEERMFLDSPRLGPAYQEYVRATGRFLPRWPSGSANPTERPP